MRVRKKIRDYYSVRSGTDFCRKSMKHVSLVWIARRKKPEGINNSKQKKNWKHGRCRSCVGIFFFCIRLFLFWYTRCPSQFYWGKECQYCIMYCIILLQCEKQRSERCVFFSFGTKFVHIQHILCFVNLTVVWVCRNVAMV